MKKIFFLLPILLVSFLYTNINAQGVPKIIPAGWDGEFWTVLPPTDTSFINPIGNIPPNQQQLGYGIYTPTTPTGVLVSGLMDVDKLDSTLFPSFPVDARFIEELSKYTNFQFYALEEETNTSTLLWVGEDNGMTFPRWITIVLDLSSFVGKKIRLVFSFNGHDYANFVMVDVGKLLNLGIFSDGGGDIDTFPVLTWKTALTFGTFGVVADTIRKGDPVPTYTPYVDYTAEHQGVDVTESVKMYTLGDINTDSLGRYLKLFVITDSLGGIDIQLITIQVVNVVGIEDIASVPKEYKLSQNYPNPFNPSTKIRFTIPKRGYVSLRAYDILGREVATLVNEEKSIGTYEVDFKASNLPSGMYVYRISVNNFVQTKKMVLVK